MNLRLRDGTDIVIRPIRAADKGLLARGVERLSARTARLRFLAAKPRLSVDELRYLTEVDGVDHFALVAVYAADPRRLAGVGRWTRDGEDRGAAEVAFLVVDELQGQGLGRALGAALVEGARARGVVRFTATILAENVAGQRMFAGMSQRLRTHVEGGTYEVVGELAA